ncbi:MAG: hypothetical protein H7Y17_10835 [Chlorobia bacterium]|nr:hypothetical protein [Fimbriimonadaceae bacterium]
MSNLCLAIGIAASMAGGIQQDVKDKPALVELPSHPIRVQFAQSTLGRTVTVFVNGRSKTTFAGKLGFRDQNRSWQSVCAEVNKPISAGQFFQVRPTNSQKIGGNVALAGNIVAKHFDSARTADQCAGLQLAVWEAIEDGGPRANFMGGKFRAMATRAAMDYAEDFYQAINDARDAAYLQSGGEGGGQGQLSSLT